jgi:hypothetical protein
VTQQSTHHHIAAARLQDRSLAQVIELFSEAIAQLCHGSRARIGEAFHNQPGGFAAGMGIDNTQGSRGVIHQAIPELLIIC